TVSAAKGTTIKKGRTVALTTEDMQKRRNDVKVRTTLLLALPDEHQLRFSKYKTAQELWAAILKTFGGNEATKKTKKNLLKQQYGNFKAERKETLEQAFNRLQAIVSQLEFRDVEIEQDDLNQKLLTSLSPERLMHTIKKSESNSQNMAFISSAKYISKNEEVNTASVSTASTNVFPASANIGIDKDDMEEMDIKWNMALLSIKADRFWKKTGKKISIQGTDVAGFDKSKVECFNCHKMGHFARECRAPRSQDRGRRDNYRQGSKVEEQNPKALMAINGVGWDWSFMANEQEDHALVADEEAPTEFALMAKTSADSEVFDNSLCSKNCLSQVEGRLAECKSQEIKFCEKIRVLEFNIEGKTNKIEYLTKELENLKNEKEGYSVVPPSPAQVYSPPKKDLSWTCIPKFVDDMVTDYNRPSPAIESTSDDAQNRNPFVPEIEASPSTISSKPFIKFVKAADPLTVAKSDKKETIRKPSVKYVELYRKPLKKSTVRGNQRNWNNLKSQQLGENFKMKNRACFYCGHFDHLSYDCGLGVKKRRPCPKNNCSNKSMTPRAVIHKSYRPPMRPVRPNMNVTQPKRTSFHKLAHSYSKRHFQRTSAVRSQYKAPWVPTVNKIFPTINRKFPTINRKFPTGSIKFSTADMGKRGNAVKALACWIWKPRQNTTNKGNISYLSDYEPFDGGYVSFGQGGCKITGKGTIKTGKLEFENVYFMKDLKYNLFSVSQIFENQNIVLFTDSECIVLGRNFKLTDDANVLLRTPRQHNTYTIDLNNIVPHKDLTCLIAKASADEGMLWLM
nr:ribonuclease H-like domain-containing protein [Tanacetum cinerariifolium]